VLEDACRRIVYGFRFLHKDMVWREEGKERVVV